MYYDYEAFMEEIWGTGLLDLLTNIPSMAFSILSYVLTSLALYDIATRRGISKPWLSWVPVGNAWIIGSLSDQYRYVVRGEVKSKRKTLVILDVITAAIAIIMIIVCIVMIISMMDMMFYEFTETDLMIRVLGPMLGILGLMLPLLGVSIAYSVIFYMALYDIYTSLEPGNSTLYLVLSILIGIMAPLLLFFNRKKDLGMPPRRQEPTYFIPQPPAQQWQPQQPGYQAQEPWQAPQSPREPWENP